MQSKRHLRINLELQQNLILINFYIQYNCFPIKNIQNLIVKYTESILITLLSIFTYEANSQQQQFISIEYFALEDDYTLQLEVISGLYDQKINLLFSVFQLKLRVNNFSQVLERLFLKIIIFPELQLPTISFTPCSQRSAFDTIQDSTKFSADSWMFLYLIIISSELDHQCNYLIKITNCKNEISNYFQVTKKILSDQILGKDLSHQEPEISIRVFIFQNLSQVKVQNFISWVHFINYLIIFLFIIKTIIIQIKKGPSILYYYVKVIKYPYLTIDRYLNNDISSIQIHQEIHSIKTLEYYSLV
ncbi:hypothetical protein pb186bvf_010545 [Paramecium bursaria]